MFQEIDFPDTGFTVRYDGRLNFKDLNDNSLLNGVQTEALVGSADF